MTEETTTIGGWRIRHQLGEGGMARVALAEREFLNGEKKVAVIKLPKEDFFLDERKRGLFLGEIRVASKLDHPNIVPVYEAGEDAGLPFIAMMFVSGQNLAKVIRMSTRHGVRLSFELAAYITQQVAYALQYAHNFAIDDVSERIIHRDVAPKNVMVSGNGAVMLTDFGVAAAVSVESSAQAVKGTLAYMAPEHSLGLATQASDCFGLGTILWELLEGKRFRHDVPTADMMRAAVSGHITPLTREVSPKLATVVHGLLALKESQRMSLREALRVLEEFPGRRTALSELMVELFGRDVQRSGHTQAELPILPSLGKSKALAKSVQEILQRDRLKQAESGVPPTADAKISAAQREALFNADWGAPRRSPSSDVPSKAAPLHQADASGGPVGSVDAAEELRGATVNLGLEGQPSFTPTLHLATEREDDAPVAFSSKTRRRESSRGPVPASGPTSPVVVPQRTNTQPVAHPPPQPSQTRPPSAPTAPHLAPSERDSGPVHTSATDVDTPAATAITYDDPQRGYRPLLWGLGLGLVIAATGLGSYVILQPPSRQSVKAAFANKMQAPKPQPAPSKVAQHESVDEPLDVAAAARAAELAQASESAVEAEPEPAAEAQPEPAVEAEPEPAVEAEPEPAVEAKPEAEPEPSTKRKSKLKPKAKSKPKSKAKKTSSIYISLGVLGEAEVTFEGQTYHLDPMSGTTKLRAADGKRTVRWRSRGGKWQSETLKVEDRCNYFLKLDRTMARQNVRCPN